MQHIPVDVQELDADFLAFSGHKLYGPSGVGVLYGKAEHLEAMPPYQGGGDMIERVSFAGTTWNEIPFKFEAGTPDIAGIVAPGRRHRLCRGPGAGGHRGARERGPGLRHARAEPGARACG